QMERSILEWFGEDDKGHRCGYCGNATGSCSYGMWAHHLLPSHYQNLIDRGWRRSGHYCYLPRHNISCCKLYTIRCGPVDAFCLTKSMRRSLHAVNNYLISDKRPTKCNPKFRQNLSAAQLQTLEGVWRIDNALNYSSADLECLLTDPAASWCNCAHTMTV